MTNQNENQQKIPMSKSKKTFITLSIIYAVIMVLVFMHFNLGGSKNLPVENFCYDNKGIFTEEQIASINATCREVQKKNRIAVFVVTCNRDETRWYDDEKAEIDGDKFLELYNFTKDDNIAAIIINTESIYSEYYFDIYTWGDAFGMFNHDQGDSLAKISQKESDLILWSEGGDLIKESNPASACQGVIECTKMIGKAYSWLIPTGSWFKICGIAIVISGAVSLIIVLSIRKSYTRKRANPTYSFANNSTLSLKLKEDQYIRSVTTSRRIETHTSSGGFSGGHSSGGGGGSGHRGGR